MPEPETVSLHKWRPSGRHLLVVSACLTGCKCRYDGKDNQVGGIAKLMDLGVCVAVCPEVLGGLPVPRTPCERCGDKVIAKDGRDCTAFFQRGAEEALKLANQYKVRTAILKARSPSCGPDHIYDGTFSHRLHEGDGVFAAMLRERGFTICTEENYLDVLPWLADLID